MRGGEVGGGSGTFRIINKCQTSSLSFLSLCRAVRGVRRFWKTEAQNLSQAQFSLL